MGDRVITMEMSLSEFQALRAVILSVMDNEDEFGDVYARALKLYNLMNSGCKYNKG